MGLHEVSTALWQERHLLEMLLFKLEEEHLLLSGGRTRWLARATNEVEVVLERIREAELVRAMEVEHVAPSLRLAPGPTLSELVGAVSSPWDTMFRDHRDAFVELTAEIAQMAASNKDLVARGHRALQDVLGTADESPRGYPSARDSSTRPALVLDLAL